MVYNQRDFTLQDKLSQCLRRLKKAEMREISWTKVRDWLNILESTEQAHTSKKSYNPRHR